MKHLRGYFDLPLVFCGDYNEILVESKKYGGAQRKETQMQGLRDVVDYCGVEDLGNHEERFTWKRGDTKERLDRFLADFGWSNKFPYAKVKMLPRYPFDQNAHALLLSKVIS